MVEAGRRAPLAPDEAWLGWRCVCFALEVNAVSSGTAVNPLGGTMSSRVTVVAASVSTLTLVALTACAPASARLPNEGDSTAIPVVARDVAPSTRAWSTTASGIVQAKTTVDVSFQVPGKVVMVGPDEGQTVHAGQII